MGVNDFLGQGLDEKSTGKKPANAWFEPDSKSTVSWFDNDVDKKFYKPVGKSGSGKKKSHKRKARRK